MDILLQLSTPISIERIPDLLPGRSYSAITFDDGFESVISNAVPALQKRNIPAAIFVTAGYIGQSAVWWPKHEKEREEKIASADMWKALPSDLICIGSHTLTHPYLSLLNEPEARCELIESRLLLEQLLHRKIISFSFPYGDFNGDLVTWCREAGYRRIFTSLPQNAFEDLNQVVSGRVKVEPTVWELEFRL